MSEPAEFASSPEELLAEARAQVGRALEALYAFAEATTSASERHQVLDAALRLASWHPYLLDRLNAGESSVPDLDELNYILDVLYEISSRQSEDAAGLFLRITLSLGRSLRLYRQIIET